MLQLIVGSIAILGTIHIIIVERTMKNPFLLKAILIALTIGKYVISFTISTPITRTRILSYYSSSYSSPSSSSLLLLNNDKQDTNNRRNLLQKLITPIILSTTTTIVPIKESIAFENKISNQYNDRPKRKGPQPKDLGIKRRKSLLGNDDDEYIGLKSCNVAPNCFCSTDNALDDPEHYIPSWIYPKSFDDNDNDSKSGIKKAFEMLEKVIREEYKPGQGNIDGGGFQIVTSDVQNGYLYIQFESLKNGYIDDVEFAYIDGFKNSDDSGEDNNSNNIIDKRKRAVQVRSSSRVGYLDFGVNAKRLNYIAKLLREKGWDAPSIDKATHPDYFLQNSTS